MSKSIYDLNYLFQPVSTDKISQLCSKIAKERSIELDTCQSIKCDPNTNSIHLIVTDSTRNHFKHPVTIYFNNLRLRNDKDASDSYPYEISVKTENCSKEFLAYLKAKFTVNVDVNYKNENRLIKKEEISSQDVFLKTLINDVYASIWWNIRDYIRSRI